MKILRTVSPWLDRVFCVYSVFCLVVVSKRANAQSCQISAGHTATVIRRLYVPVELRQRTTAQRWCC